ncbi:hypothetical protein EV148_1241, partial [Dokdonella fugitiva]
MDSAGYHCFDVGLIGWRKRKYVHGAAGSLPRSHAQSAN